MSVSQPTKPPYFEGEGNSFRLQEGPVKGLIRSKLEMPRNNLIKQFDEWKSTEKSYNDSLLNMIKQLGVKGPEIIEAVGESRYGELLQGAKKALTASDNILTAMDTHLSPLVVVGADGKKSLATDWSDKIEGNMANFSKELSRNMSGLTDMVVLYDKMGQTKESEMIQGVFSQAGSSSSPPYNFAQDFIKPAQRNPRHEMLTKEVMNWASKARALDQSGIDVEKEVQNTWDNINAEQNKPNAFSATPANQEETPIKYLSGALKGKQESAVEELIRGKLINPAIDPKLKEVAKVGNVDLKNAKEVFDPVKIEAMKVNEQVKNEQVRIMGQWKKENPIKSFLGIKPKENDLARIMKAAVVNPSTITPQQQSTVPKVTTQQPQAATPTAATPTASNLQVLQAKLANQAQVATPTNASPAAVASAVAMQTPQAAPKPIPVAQVVAPAPQVARAVAAYPPQKPKEATPAPQIFSEQGKNAQTASAAATNAKPAVAAPASEQPKVAQPVPAARAVAPYPPPKPKDEEVTPPKFKP